MAKIAKELIRIVNMSMPFPANVLKAYARLDAVFTSGEEKQKFRGQQLNIMLGRWLSCI